MDKIKITPVTSQEDLTPTPTKFLASCDSIGIFRDLEMNPFDATFKKAIDTPHCLPKISLTAPNPEETLNTPTPFQMSSIDISKASNVCKDLPLALDKEDYIGREPIDLDKGALDLTDKHTELPDESLDLTDKSSPSLRSPFVSTDIIPDENSNISMKSSISSVSLRSPINYSLDYERDPSSNSDDSRIRYDVIKSVKPDDSAKAMPSKNKLTNSTSESIRKYLNKKKNKNNGNELVLSSEQAHNLLTLSTRLGNPLYGSNQLLALKTESECLDSMVEKLGALNPKSFQSPPPPPKLLALLPPNAIDLKAIPSAPEIDVIPIPSPGSEKVPLPRKQDEDPVSLVKKKSRELTEEEKKAQTLERNRLAAKRSRERQKAHQHALEVRLKEKELECKRFKLEVRDLRLKLLAQEKEIDNLAHMKARQMLDQALGDT